MSGGGTASPEARAAGRARLALWVLALVGILLVGRALDAPALAARALGWVRDLGPWGPALFALLYVAAAVLLIPGAVLTLGAGALFGVVQGFLVVSTAATLGATAAFLVGRHLARERVARWLDGYPRLRALDEAVGREGWKIVGLTRLSPVFPYNLLNYAYGLTRVRLGHYVLASWVGMMPGGLLYVYLGSLAGDLATLGAGGPGRSVGQWAAYALGLAATAAATVYVTRLARAALGRRGAA